MTGCPFLRLTITTLTEPFNCPTKEDKTLKQVREWARKQEKGYNYKEGVLVHRRENVVGDMVERIVVPVCRKGKCGMSVMLA